MSAIYTPPNSELWSGRDSGNGAYIHEVIGFLNLEENNKLPAKSVVILGYCCDEGVRRNQGRPGAKDGYFSIIGQLGKLPVHHDKNFKVFDAGTIQCKDKDMEAAQQALSKKVEQIVSSGARPLILGGGHDIAYGHYMGLKKLNPAIINIDAHFDLRIPAPDGNSGTPFYQIAKQLKDAAIPFEYLVLGIRKDANDKILFRTAEELKVAYVENQLLQHRHGETIPEKLSAFIKKANTIYLTIDLDVFASAYAPGVSAASPVGISPGTGELLIRSIVESGKVCSIDIAEMNPAVDRDSQTAKLAALLISNVLQHWSYSSQDL